MLGVLIVTSVKFEEEEFVLAVELNEFDSVSARLKGETEGGEMGVGEEGEMVGEEVGDGSERGDMP